MVIFRNNICFLLLFLIISPNIFPQTTNNEVYRFLEVSPSARVSALGGNHVAIFNGTSSLMHLNPAYLDNSSTNIVSATFVNFLSDAKYGFVNYAVHYENFGTIGVGIRYAGYGDFTEYDINGVDVGTLNTGDFAFSSSISTELTNNLRAGVGLDYIYSKYGKYNSSALLGNAGLYYINIENRFSAGIAIRNLGDQLNYYNKTREDLPFDLSIGFSKKPEKFPFQISVTLRRLNDWNLRVSGEESSPNFVDQLLRHILIGGEAALGKNFELRFGYNKWQYDQTKIKENFDFAGVGIGIGINLKKVEVDISRMSLSDIGGVVQISVRTKAM